MTALVTSAEWEEMDFGDCAKISGGAWAPWRNRNLPKLKKGIFNGCFNEHGDGAEDLITALISSSELEELDFFCCSKVPDSAWERVPKGAWSRLLKCVGIPDKHIKRIRGPSSSEKQKVLAFLFKLQAPIYRCRA